MKDNNFEKKLARHSENMKNSIDAPFDICEKLNEADRQNTEKVVPFKTFKKVMYSAAAFAAVFLLTFNCVPSLALKADKIPVLGDVVRVVTFGRFEVKEANYEAKVVTPEVEGIVNKELEEKINREFKENADAVIAAFENDVEELREKNGDDSIFLGVTADYAVRTDNDKILAIDFYVVKVQASAAETHRFYNIDKKRGELIELSSLFKADADYIKPISEYILSEMKAQNDNEEGLYFTDAEDPQSFKEIREDQNFFINNDGNIVICFDEYEVAAGAQGSPEFEIPMQVVKDILK